MKQVINFSTHIQRKRIATISSASCGRGRLAFQPISSESGLRLEILFGSKSFDAFQPISSESGLRQSTKTYPTILTWTFQPISSESGLRQCGLKWGLVDTSFSTHIQRKRIATNMKRTPSVTLKLLFNPYPAKADCDKFPIYPLLVVSSFQPISSESGLRPCCFEGE